MNAILNLLWIIFGGGIIIALEYAIAGALLCLTVIGIPFGVQAFKLAGLAIWPFGADIREVEGGTGLVSAVGNILWFLLAGLWIGLSHLSLAIGLALTIIGIPFALQHIKLAVFALWPFGRAAV